MSKVTMYLIIEQTADSGKAIRVGENIWLPLSLCKITPVIEIITKRRSRFISRVEADRKGWTLGSHYALDDKGEAVLQTRQKALVEMPLALAVSKFPSAFETATPKVITDQSVAAARRDIELEKENEAYRERREREGRVDMNCGGIVTNRLICHIVV